MHLLSLLGLASVVLAAPQQQLPFLSPSSSPSLLPNDLPTQAYKPPSQLSDLPAEHLTQLQEHISQWPETRRVRVRSPQGGAGSVIEISEGEKSLMTLAGLRFVDITNDEFDLGEEEVVVESDHAVSYPSKLVHNSSSLSPLFESISLQTIKEFLTKFTSFRTRYYRSQSGRDSQLFLLDHLKELHQTLNKKAKLQFREFDHEWIQKSIIVRWEPTIKTESYKDEVVIISAHQDSTNSLPFLPAPGADDDASGTVTLISTLTQLLAHGYEPVSNPVEFHFYSAEEGGLLGSGEIAKEYREKGKKVKAMFHMDVVAYIKPGTEPVIGMIMDGTNAALSEFMKLLVDEFATIPYSETRCGFGCSDFASFTKYGFPSTCLAEGKFEDSNPNMHSMKDTINAEGYSLEHIREYVRVAIGFAIELGAMEKKTGGKKGRNASGRWRME
ncbi:hypothetical protein JCM3765_000539 [Sporobolomyces pararoseus]